MINPIAILSIVKISQKTDEVSYKEYSPLQGMSVTHGLMALANHSNGKRVTMWCNDLYLYQEVP